MKQAIFEVTTLADAVAKANRVAPTKGAAYDRAAGICLHIDPSSADEAVVIKSTDTEVSFRMVVSALELGDEPAVWRVPSTLFHAMMSQLPIGVGSQVRVVDTGDGHLYFQAGRTKAKLMQIVGDFPEIPKFDAGALGPVPAFARRLAQVSWACDDRTAATALSGVHLDGEYLYGCNRASLAIVPCRVPVDRPVTSPLAEVASIIKNTGEVHLRAGEHKLEIMPDPYTQATTVLIMTPYPNVRALLKETFNQKLEVKSEELIAGLDRMLVLVKSERHPITTIKIEKDVMHLDMDVPGTGRIVSDVEITGGSDVPFTFGFQPDMLKQALMASGRVHATLDYGPTNMDPIRLTDDNDFMCLMMPMRTST